MDADAGEDPGHFDADKTPLTGDQYIELLEQRRRAAWDGRGWPPLLEWFICPGDERLFTPPAHQPPRRHTPPRRSRRRVPLQELTRRRDALVAQRDAAAAPLVSDTAAVRGAALGRRRTRTLQTRQDHRLQRYAKLTQRIEELDSHISRYSDPSFRRPP